MRYPRPAWRSRVTSASIAPLLLLLGEAGLEALHRGRGKCLAAVIDERIRRAGRQLRALLDLVVEPGGGGMRRHDDVAGQFGEPRNAAAKQRDDFRFRGELETVGRHRADA